MAAGCYTRRGLLGKGCVLTGPVSDNKGGTAAVEREFAVPAHNARRDGEALTKLVLEVLFP